MIRIWAFLDSRAADRGATMVEYAMILFSIALVALVGASLIGPVVNDHFIRTEDCANGVC